MGRRATPSSTSGPEAEQSAVAALRVTLVGVTRSGGFYRCGRYWTATPVLVPVGSLTEDEIARLRAETMLSVEDLTAENIEQLRASAAAAEQAG